MTNKFLSLALSASMLLFAQAGDALAKRKAATAPEKPARALTLKDKNLIEGAYEAIYNDVTFLPQIEEREDLQKAGMRLLPEEVQTCKDNKAYLKDTRRLAQAIPHRGARKALMSFLSDVEKRVGACAQPPALTMSPAEEDVAAKQSDAILHQILSGAYGDTGEDVLACLRTLIQSEKNSRALATAEGPSPAVKSVYHSRALMMRESPASFCITRFRKGTNNTLYRQTRAAQIQKGVQLKF